MRLPIVFAILLAIVVAAVCILTAVKLILSIILIIFALVAGAILCLGFTLPLQKDKENWFFWKSMEKGGK